MWMKVKRYGGCEDGCEQWAGGSRWTGEGEVDGWEDSKDGL